MKYKAIIFDLFGTLSDSYDAAAYDTVLREASSLLKIPFEDFLRLWQETAIRRGTGGFKTMKENLEYICREMKVSATPGQISRVMAIRKEYLIKNLAPRPGTIDGLRDLKSEGYILGLISNCTMEIPGLWRETAMAPFFDKTLFSPECGVQKPDPRIFRIAVERLNVKAGECLFIDDNGNNLRAAVSTGMDAILFTEPGGEEHIHVMEPQQTVWDGRRVKSMREFTQYLKDEHEV
jgi:putative hydrolase of the HAD superfamily